MIEAVMYGMIPSAKRRDPREPPAACSVFSRRTTPPLLNCSRSSRALPRDARAPGMWAPKR